jgi:hypothetical protein
MDSNVLGHNIERNKLNWIFSYIIWLVSAEISLKHTYSQKLPYFVTPIRLRSHPFASLLSLGLEARHFIAAFSFSVWRQLKKGIVVATTACYNIPQAVKKRFSTLGRNIYYLHTNFVGINCNEKLKTLIAGNEWIPHHKTILKMFQLKRMETASQCNRFNLILSFVSMWIQFNLPAAGKMKRKGDAKSNKLFVEMYFHFFMISFLVSGFLLFVLNRISNQGGKKKKLSIYLQLDFETKDEQIEAYFLPSGLKLPTL